MKLIPLSKQGKHKGKYFAMVSDEDYDAVIKYDWCVSISRNTQYAISFQCNKENKKGIYLHRFILSITDGNIFIDHKDRNGLNCQRDNIRIATRSQNTHNSKPNGASKYIGVVKARKRWKAQLSIGGKYIYIGNYKTEKEAAIAFNEAAIKYHKDFANLNPIE